MDTQIRPREPKMRVRLDNCDTWKGLQWRIVSRDPWYRSTGWFDTPTLAWESACRQFERWDWR